MKKIKVIIGIDVSKSKMDVYIFQKNLHFIVDNTSEGYVVLLERIINSTACNKEDIFICFENTGKYSRMLSIFLHTEGIKFLMESALRIKRSLGLARGKNDKIDAQRIALYAYEKFDRLEPTVLPGSLIDQIKSLLTLREKLIKHRTAFKNGLKDLHDCYIEGENDLIREVQNRQIDSLTQEIEKVESAIIATIKQNEQLYRNYTLILSVKGIGKILGFYLISYTANFTLFASARAFACFAGIAPFGYSSGIVNGRSRVHPLGNKTIKSLLNLAALSAIQQKGEYKIYYKKRTEELGKNKMSTINIIRNKIVFRVFAVVQRQTPYVDLLKFVA